MAKATLEYDLSDPDDVMEHKRAIKSRYGNGSMGHCT